MCGRYRLEGVTYTDMKNHFDWLDDRFKQIVDNDPVIKMGEIFPGTNILTVNNKREPELAWWTIRDADNKGTIRNTINARSEGVYWVKMYKEAFKTNRVLIPATAFHEWKNKVRYTFTFDDPLFAFGGIARTSEIKGEDRWCSVIMTTKANDIVREIHTKDRMPIVVYKHDYEKWLDPDTDRGDLARIMQPAPNDYTHIKK